MELGERSNLWLSKFSEFFTDRRVSKRAIFPLRSPVYARCYRSTRGKSTWPAPQEAVVH